MAPEQAIGEQVDRRTDIFALGVVLYQLVTGTHPFRADNEFATLARIRDIRPVDPPRTLVPSLPEELSQVIVTALEKDRGKRYATMLDFARAIERAVPAPPDADQKLAAFMASLLSQRAARKRQLLADAIREVNVRRDADARPKSLSLHLPDDVEESVSSRRAPADPVFELAAVPGPGGALPHTPGLASPAAPPVVARPARAGANGDDVDLAYVRRGRLQQRLPVIAAGVAVLVLAIVVVWSIVEGGPGPVPPMAPSADP